MDLIELIKNNKLFNTIVENISSIPNNLKIGFERLYDTASYSNRESPNFNPKRVVYGDSIAQQYDKYIEDYPTMYERNKKKFTPFVDNLYRISPNSFDIPLNGKTNYSIGNRIWKTMQEYPQLTTNQKLGLLANSYLESNGWTTQQQYDNGKAVGYFQMEPGTLQKYKKWLGNRENTPENQTRYVVELFVNKDKNELRTALDRNPSHKAARALPYTSEQMWKAWNSDSLDNNILAVTALFERSGTPHMDRRQKIGQILSRFYYE